MSETDDPYEWLRTWAEDVTTNGPGELFGPACDALHAVEALDAAQAEIKSLNARLQAQAVSNHSLFSDCAELRIRAEKAEAEAARLAKALDNVYEGPSPAGLLFRSTQRVEKAEAQVAAVRAALDDEEANLADDGARLSHSVVRRVRASLDGAVPPPAAPTHKYREPSYQLMDACIYPGCGKPESDPIHGDAE